MGKKRRNTAFWNAVFCVAVILCIVCACFVGWYLYRNYLAERRYQSARNQVKEEVTETEEDKTTLEDVEAAVFDGWREGPEPKLPENVKSEMVENPIDFEKLQEINPELYAWVEIPDTAVDYPVAQSAGDDSFYLKHNMYGEPEFAGCIYTESQNSKDFSDPMTVMYGHNMRNGSMFQNLHMFADEEFFKEHPYFYIYMPGRRLTYEVFAAYAYDDRHLLNSFDFTDQDVFSKYLEKVRDGVSMGQHIREDVEVTALDKVLTLSTCIGGQTTERYLVQAVLQKDEKTK